MVKYYYFNPELLRQIAKRRNKMEITINGIKINHAMNGSITIRNGELIIDGKILSTIKDLSNVTIKGNVNNLSVTGSVTIEVMLLVK